MGQVANFLGVQYAVINISTCLKEVNLAVCKYSRACEDKLRYLVYNSPFGGKSQNYSGGQKPEALVFRIVLEIKKVLSNFNCERTLVIRMFVIQTSLTRTFVIQ